MNVNEATHQTFLPACGSYDAQLWPGWRQDACYPAYYATGSETSFPCNSSSTFMPPQRFEFPLMPSHHPPFELPQPMQHSQQVQPSHPAISSSISSSSSSGSSSAEPSSSTPHMLSSHVADQITSSFNSPDNQPTSSTKPTSECSSEIDSTKESGVSSLKEEILLEPSHVKQEATSSDCTSSKKKRDRFNGLTEEDVLKRTVPDLLAHNLDIIIIGSCPGLTAAYLGHHYAGPGNHFWKCLYLSRLIPEPMNASDDFKLKQYGIGFTNFVARCTKGSVEFSRREIKEGIESLTEKIQNYKPKIAVFNGKGIYEVFCNHKNFYIGKQPEMFPGTNTVVYVMPSSSARCSQLPRASDKVPFFVALRKLRDHLMGSLPHLDESEVVFPDLDLKVEPRKDRRSSDDVSAAAQQSHARPSSREERKRKMMDCSSAGFGDVMTAQRMMYRGFVPHQDFNGWGSPGCFPGWPHPTLALPPSHHHQYPNYDAAFASMTNVSPAADPCGFFRNIHSSPFYPGWTGETQHHRWAMTHPHFPGTPSVPDPRYNIPPYFQSFAPSDMLSTAALVGPNKKEVTSSSFALPIPFLDACRPHQLDPRGSSHSDARSQSLARMQFQARMFAPRPSSFAASNSSSSSSLPVNPYHQMSHQSYE